MWAFLNQFFNALIYNGISWILGCNKNRSIFLWSPSVIPKAHSSLYIYGVHFFFFNRFSQIDGFIRIFSSKKVADLYARLAHWLPIPSVQLLEHTFCDSFMDWCKDYADEKADFLHVEIQIRNSKFIRPKWKKFNFHTSLDSIIHSYCLQVDSRSF